jgi:hypothetical protein
MSAPAPSGSDEPLSPPERAELLKRELIGRFGERRGTEMFRQAQAATLRRIGRDSAINVLEASDVRGVLSRIWTDGLAGLSSADLLRVDNLLSDTVLKHRKMLRFLKYYVQDPEYAAIDTSFQLIARIQDRSGDAALRSKMIRSLYDRLGRLRYGRRVYNQLSVGWLESLTYPQMVELENRLSPAGRAHEGEKEQIAQIFYRSLEPDSTKLWVKSTDDAGSVFGEIADRLCEIPPPPRPIPYLDVYAIGAAIRIRDAAISDFLSSYLQYEEERHGNGQEFGAGFVRLKLRPRW